jgi:hypothetical protein
MLSRPSICPFPFIKVLVIEEITHEEIFPAQHVESIAQTFFSKSWNKQFRAISGTAEQFTPEEYVIKRFSNL